jgi:CAAX prenyl protease-like protein
VGSFTAQAEWRDSHPSLQYVAPFAVVILFIAITPYVPLAAFWLWPLQVLAGGVVCFLCWPDELSLRPGFPFASIAIGLAVFAIWIAPDLLLPGYRKGILFSNSILGQPHSSLPLAAQRSSWVLAWRMARATVVVPVAEELFWRGWMMRWLIHSNFQSVRLGTYAPLAFWLTALLFASEHGPYWDVGLVTGIIYNGWMVRSRNLADCILMHAVTNFVLSAYVLKTGNWQYWM